MVGWIMVDRIIVALKCQNKVDGSRRGKALTLDAKLVLTILFGSQYCSSFCSGPASVSSCLLLMSSRKRTDREGCKLLAGPRESVARTRAGGSEPFLRWNSVSSVGLRSDTIPSRWQSRPRNLTATWLDSPSIESIPSLDLALTMMLLLCRDLTQQVELMRTTRIKAMGQQRTTAAFRRGRARDHWTSRRRRNR